MITDHKEPDVATGLINNSRNILITTAEVNYWNVCHVGWSFPGNSMWGRSTPLNENKAPKDLALCASEKRASPISSWLSFSASQFDPVIFFLVADVTTNNL